MLTKFQNVPNPMQASWKRTAGTNDEWRMPITVTHPLQSHTGAFVYGTSSRDDEDDVVEDDSHDVVEPRRRRR